MKLFTKSDLERTARLATLYGLAERDPEAAIFKAVEQVADESPGYLDVTTVRDVVATITGARAEAAQEMLEQALAHLERRP